VIPKYRFEENYATKKDGGNSLMLMFSQDNQTSYDWIIETRSDLARKQK